jgi:hypothetical protein
MVHKPNPKHFAYISNETIKKSTLLPNYYRLNQQRFESNRIN